MLSPVLSDVHDGLFALIMTRRGQEHSVLGLEGYVL